MFVCVLRTSRWHRLCSLKWTAWQQPFRPEQGMCRAGEGAKSLPAYAEICLARVEPNSWTEARRGLSPDDSWMTARSCVSPWGLVAQVGLESLFEGRPVRAEGVQPDFAVQKLFEPSQRTATDLAVVTIVEADPAVPAVSETSSCCVRWLSGGCMRKQMGPRRHAAQAVGAGVGHDRSRWAGWYS